MKVGFVGVGIMGHGMAANLLAAGHDLTVVAHRNRTPVEDLVSKGATEAASINDLARNKDVIILCVTGTPAARAVVTRLVPDLTPDTLVVDTTTNAPDAPAELSAIVASSGGRYVEAPVTGGTRQATEGVLGAIVGCAPSDFDHARAVLSCFCKQVEYFGPVGMGARTKLVSNFLALGTATLVIEAFRQARTLGIDWRKLYELAQLGSGNSSSLQRIVGNAIHGDFGGYVFTIGNTVKDFTYICDLIDDDSKAPALAPVMKAMFERATEAGYAERLISELLAPDVELP